jgi:UDP:flavonoid glycosyltransferase YjiC (YdhE family)
MKILVVSTPATGHVNPLLTVARMMAEAGHDVVFQSGSVFRPRIEAFGLEFRARWCSSPKERWRTTISAC